MDEEDDTTGRSRLYTVFGGTGFVGRRIVRALLAHGHQVRIAARHPQREDGSPDRHGAQRMRADLFEPETLKPALQGADGVVNATSLYLERGAMTFDAMHVDAAARLARLAGQAGVRRFVQLSGIGADPDAADSYIRARGRGEHAVRRACPEAVIVRSAVMFGEGDALVPAITGAARRSPIMPLFGAGRTRLQPVCADDVAQGIATLLTQESTRPLYEFGGPRILSYRTLVSEVLTAAGKRRPLVPVPFGAWKLMARIAEHLPGAPLTRSQVALIEIDTVADDSLPGLADLVGSRTDLSDYIQRTAANRR